MQNLQKKHFPLCAMMTWSKNIGCRILPEEEIWVSVGGFHHQLLPIHVYQRQRCPERLHPSKLPSCQLFHEIHYIFQSVFCW
jgi:hypothetical protein